MLIKCSECGKKVSDKATTCPHCGAPVEISIQANAITRHEAAVREAESRPQKENVSIEGKDGIGGRVISRAGSAKRIWKYIREALLISGILFVSCYCWIFLSLMLTAVMGREGENTAWALAIGYMAWPIEIVVRKHHSAREGRIVGNILYGIVGVFVGLASIGFVFNEWMSQQGCFAFLDFIPVGVVAVGVKLIKDWRLYCASSDDSQLTPVQDEI